MNKYITFLATITLTVLASFAKAEEPKSEIKIVAVKSHSIYFKVDEAFVGGVVEVYDASKKLLESEELPNTHSKVLFHEKPSGRYLIKVKKGNKEVEFGYIHI